MKNSPQESMSWDLTPYYVDSQDPNIIKDLEDSKILIQEFSASYEGNLATLSGSKFLEAVKAYEAIYERVTKPAHFAYLLFAKDALSFGEFFQNIQEQVNSLMRDVVFFRLEINALEEKVLESFYKECQELFVYKSWLDEIRAFKPYQLSKDQETLFHDFDGIAHANWVRLYDEHLASLRFSCAGEDDLNLGAILNLMSSKVGDIRKQAAQSLSEALNKNSSLFTLVYNTLLKNRQIQDQWRSFKDPISFRNLSNLIEDEVVDSLLDSVQESYKKLSHRYYAMKASWMGQEKMHYWDRSAPLPLESTQTFSWHEAQSIVLKAYKDFSPIMGAIGEKFFVHQWIDADLAPNKQSGAFSMAGQTHVPPYILMNFHGKVRDVSTLAHELGHGIHQFLSKKQGYLLSDTPLTIAETASIFGEMLVFKELIVSYPQDKKALMAQKVEDMLSTVVRQVAFCIFEKKAHALRRKKELSFCELGELWMEVQQDSLGPAFILEDSYRSYWSYISHFFHAPFYVYAYAFADCLVNSLYTLYEKGFPQFEEIYLEILKAGGSISYKEILMRFGFNPSKKDFWPSFWEQGLNLISSMIDDLDRAG